MVSAQDTTLTLWIMPNGPDPAGAITPEIEAFEAANPGVNVEFEVIDWGSAYTRITNAAISGEGADVTQLGTTWVGAIDALGALHHFSPEEIAEVGGAENFAAASWNTVVRADDSSGDVVSLPWFIDTRAVVYRTDIFEDLGLDPATAFADWDTFVATLQTIQNAGLTVVDETSGEALPVSAIGFPGKNDWNVLHNFAPWVWSAGGDMLAEDLSGATFTSAEGIAGIEFYSSLYTMGLTPPDALELNSAQIEGLFNNGRIAVMISGPWNIANSRTPISNNGWVDTEDPEALWPDSLGVAQIPAGPGGQYTFVGGSNLGVFEASPNLDLAIDLAQFLTGVESQIRYTQAIGMLPSNSTALADEIFTGDDDFSAFIDAVANGRSYPAIAAWGPIETIMVTNLGALWDDVAGVNGTFDPATQIPTRLEAASQEVNQALADAS